MLAMSPLIRADDVLQAKLSPKEAVALEYRYGNKGLIHLLDSVGAGGPFEVVSPWEYQDSKGFRTIGAAGYSALPFGEAYPPLVEFMSQYLQQNRQMGLPQQSASTWRAALEHNLVNLLSQYAPSHANSRVFFSNSGAEAIEAAAKFAKASRPKATHFINFKRAYHGKTMMALSLTPNPTLQDVFKSMLTPATTLPYGDIEALRKTIRRLGEKKIVAVILEPILGEAGVILPPTGYLKAVHELCRQHGILMIADEIQTGLGRTGHYFQSLADGLEPDIIALAKPLGGGMVPIGATIVRQAIFKQMLGPVDAIKRHSNTFGGNSLSMAVGLKALELIVENDYPARARTLGAKGLARLQALQAKHPAIFADVRGAGLLMGMNFQPIVATQHALLRTQTQLVNEVTGLFALKTFYDYGVQLNFSLNAARTMRITPAFTMPEPLFDQIFDRLEQASAEVRTPFRMLSRISPLMLARLLQYVAENG